MDYFSTLPEALFDSILQFSDVKDIISFSNTSTEHKIFVETITLNPQTQVSNVYEMTEITDIESWIYLDQFKFKFAKQYYNIYKNLGKYFELDFSEVKRIFYGMFDLVREIYHLETNNDKNQKYEYIVMTLFEFININNHIFDGIYIRTPNSSEGNIIKYNGRSKILDLLFKLYSQDFDFVNYTEIEAILINMFQEKINRLVDIEPVQKMDEFIVEYLEGWFYFTQVQEESVYTKLGYIREMLEDMIIEAGMGTMFLLPEE